MKMKYRSLVPLALAVLMFVSIYSLISGSMTQQKEVNDLLSKAKTCTEQGLYDKAASYYNDLISKDDNVKHYLAVTDMYYTAEQYEASYTWAEKTLTAFPKEASAYDRMIKVCLKKESYSEAYEILAKYDGRKLKSDAVEKYRTEMEYLYWIDSISFDEVRQYSSSYVAFKNKGKWGLATTKGSSKVKAKFADVGYYANDMVAVLDDEGVWYFMNVDGEYVYNISDSVGGKITEVGLYHNDLFSVCTDGKYNYYDIKFKKKLEGYDYAGSFSGGVAAVKKDDKWEVINSKGENITGEKYLDVILDSRGVCCQKDRIFVKIADYEYIMINSAGERVGKETFESAKLFSNGEYAAIMRNELWGFVDINGKTYVEPKYEGANSYSLGLAAVSENGLWGYIDAKGNEIVEKKYLECLNFASTGTAYAKGELYWDVVKLYKYNY